MKIIYFMLCVVLSVSLFSCGNETDQIKTVEFFQENKIEQQNTIELCDKDKKQYSENENCLNAQKAKANTKKSMVKESTKKLLEQNYKSTFDQD